MQRAIPVALVAALAAAAAGHAGTSLPRGSEPVKLDPHDFTTRIDNPYWPMARGSRWVYRETDASGSSRRIVVAVTRRVKTVVGIKAVVVHDIATEDGQVVEDTYDWYAQDVEGNVWYLGEDTTSYENGKPVSKSGSWQAGVRGAQPGVIIPAKPRPGLAYRQEYLAGEAEDRAVVVGLSGTARVPFRSFRRLVVTREWSPIEPGHVERKYYARGVGPVLAETVAGGSDREVLVSYVRP